MRANSYRLLCILISLPAALSLAGCGGSSSGISGPTSTPANNPPAVTFIQPDYNPYLLDITQTQFLDITIRADDSDGDRLNCVWTWDAGLMSPAESTVDAGTEVASRFTPPTYDGPCMLKISVSDGEATVSQDFAIQVTGWNIGPGNQLRILSISMSPDPAAPASVAEFSATVDNPGGGPLSYSWKTKYGSISGAGSSATWITPDTPGVYGIYLTVSDGTSSASAGKAAMVTGPTGGLLGQYFTTYRDKNVVRFENLVLSRVDPTINFSWEKLSPDPDLLPVEGFGARWTGSIKCQSPGSYVFRVHVDDGARMRIEDDTGQWVEVIPNNPQNWSDHTEGAWLPETPVPVPLQGGKWYPVELDYFEGGGNAYLSLYWSIDGGAEEIIPQDCLMPPG